MRAYADHVDLRSREQTSVDGDGYGSEGGADGGFELDDQRAGTDSSRVDGAVRQGVTVGTHDRLRRVRREPVCVARE